MMSMDAEPSAWPFTGRDDLVERTIEAINEDRGAVLLGRQGIGKTALAHRVLEILREDHHLIRLRGAAAYSNTPYGCLGVLISRLASTTFDHPMGVLQSLIHHIAETSRGRKTVLFVDNAQHLDASSAMVISQLAHYGSASVVAACSDLMAAPAEITRLWRDGLLRRVDIGPLSAAEAADMLAAGLDGPLSRWASTSLWRSSGGNPLLLQGFARELVRCGQLQRPDGIWVRDGSHPRHSRAFMELMSSRLAQLPPDERDAVEIVSLAGMIDFDLLRQVVDGSIIDALQESGTIDVAFDERPVVTLGNALAAEVIAESVPPGRKLTLLERVESAGRGPVGLEGNICSMTAWSLGSGRTVEGPTVLRAARMANRSGEPQTALQLLARLPAHPSDVEAVIEEAKARSALGQWQSYRRVLGQYAASSGPSPSISEGVELALVRFAADYKEAATAEVANEALRQVRSRLMTGGNQDDAPPGGELSGGELGGLLEQVELAGLEALGFHGDYDRILRDAQADGFAWIRSPSSRVTADGWVCEAAALTGDHVAGSALAADIRERLNQGEFPERTEHDVLQRLFAARFWSGDWNTEAATTVPPPADSAYRRPDDELNEGVLQAGRGRAANALGLLLPAVAQARVHDPADRLPLGLAAAAYAHALEGDIKSAKATLADDGMKFRQRLPLQLEQAVDYFIAMAAARVTGLAEPVTAALSNAGQQPFTCWSQELLLVSSAVRLGERAMAARLQLTAEKCEGDFARLCGLYGRAVEARDSELLLTAAGLAARAGNDLFCYDAAKLALSTATAEKNAGRARAAQELLAVYRDAMGWPDGSASASQVLTTREREIALRAARGEPSRLIAKDLSVSVRTVEGHLHQVYGKLHVNSRVDLIDALA